MTKYRYFFGTDLRSIPYLMVLHNNNTQIKVVTTPANKKGRGGKLQYNAVEEYCIKNNLEFIYYSQDDIYEDMEFGISASFSKIFTSDFLRNNNKVFNIHLSLLPKLRGPSPVEFSILNQERITGFTVFHIDEDIDTGKIVYQQDIEIKSTDYASDIYDKLAKLFNESYSSINFNSHGNEQTGNSSLTSKFNKSNLDIGNDNLQIAKIKIRAFNVLGPAFTFYKNKLLKIHSYTEEVNSEGIMLNEELLYPEYVTPEGKKRMLFPDYIRGIK